MAKNMNLYAQRLRCCLVATAAMQAACERFRVAAKSGYVLTPPDLAAYRAMKGALLSMQKALKGAKLRNEKIIVEVNPEALDQAEIVKVYNTSDFVDVEVRYL